MNPVAFERKDSLGPHVAGELIDGKYLLERPLGAGAMGRVWLARNVMLDLPVAIKIVDAADHGTDAMARVLAEARLLAQLSHPNIVRVLDCHSDDDAAYVVMELLEGCTLAELMEEGPLPAALAVRLALPLLDALAAAHRAGVVHRDIKPENIFVALRDTRVFPKLLDFGIARSESSQHSANSKRVVVGTPGYMSPEQAWGEDVVDHRADIWATGVVLYEAVSGTSAYNSSNYTSYLRALRERKLLPLHGAGCEGLWLVLRRALSRSCDERYASASEFAATLRLWLRTHGVREDLSSDSLPEHWALAGSVLHRAFCHSATRSSMGASRARSRRRPLAGSETLVDPRVDPHHESSQHGDSVLRRGIHEVDSLPDTQVSPAIARREHGGRVPRLAAWAAVATALCGTLALLHARADFRSAPVVSTAVQAALSLAAKPATEPRAATARKAEVAPAPVGESPPEPRSEPAEPRATAATASPTPEPAALARERATNASQPRAAKASAAQVQPGLQRAIASRSLARAPSASRPWQDTLRERARELGLKSPW